MTSQIAHIGCIKDVIREGRAALVTSFSCFKYMALYSIIQFTTISMLYVMGFTLGDWQFLYFDLVIIIPLAFFSKFFFLKRLYFKIVGKTEAYDKISRKRPTASLVSKRVLTSLFGQMILQVFFQTYFFWDIRKQPW